MTMKIKPKQSASPFCSMCGQYHLPVITCETGYVCELCIEKTRTGRDGTTRAVKTTQRSLRAKAEKARTLAAGGELSEQLDYDIVSADILAEEAFQPQGAVSLLAGGEICPQHLPELMDTLAAPNVVALDASAHRLDLVTRMGVDIAALALDAADTMVASNSLEKMLAHQMAVLHDNAMLNASKAALEQDPVHSVRMMNLSIRAMETFQKGLLTFKRLRGSGEQKITIQHVNVTQGGQAVIGQVHPGGAGGKL
jgi:hypothetical protein